VVYTCCLGIVFVDFILVNNVKLSCEIKVHKELENLVNFGMVKSLDFHVGPLEISHLKLH
jgi:hypothetical protein